MPPLPSTAQSLAARLNSLSDSHKATLQLIQRLSKLDSPSGASSPRTEDGDQRFDLTAEIHANLNQLDEELELLRQEVQDFTQIGSTAARRRESFRKSEKARLAVLLARLTEDLKTYVTTANDGGLVCTDF
jgi:protein transport protein SEC20